MDFVLYQKLMLLTTLEIQSMIHHTGEDKFGYVTVSCLFDLFLDQYQFLGRSSVRTLF